MNKYYITLEPLTPFFFGGENTFGEGKINYFARSNYLPQQTTLLGMLRHELLIQNDLIGTDPKLNDWNSLIGENSFQKLNNQYIDDFGAIKNISPVFLSNGKEHYTTQALDWAYCEVDNGIKINNCPVKDKKIAPLFVDFEGNNDGIVIFNNSAEPIPVLEVNMRPYDPKYGLVSLWVNNDGKTLRQWIYENPKEFDNTVGFENGFFIKHVQVGIHRKISKKRDEEGDFYKQVYYKLVDNFMFAFFLDIELPAGRRFDSRIITMAGERSVFQMTVADANGLSFESIFTASTFKEKHSRKHDVIILTSNCLCNGDVLDNCLFSINDEVNFQNIVTLQKINVNYAAFNRGVNKSGENLKLLKRGSVLYPKSGKINDVINSLQNDALSKIGYNKYLLINK